MLGGKIYSRYYATLVQFLCICGNCYLPVNENWDGHLPSVVAFVLHSEARLDMWLVAIQVEVVAYFIGSWERTLLTIRRILDDSFVTSDSDLQDGLVCL